MISVYPRSAGGRPFPFGAFLRASSLHVGAAAAAASLRRELVDDQGSLDGATFDESYAVARLTPGTNLLAMYTLLGRHFSGWRGALLALTVGAVVPAAIAVAVAAVYVEYADQPLAAAAMRGARAGALAVLLWAAVRLLRPQLERQRRRAVVVAAATLILSLTLPIEPFVFLVVGAIAGSLLLKGET